MSINRILFFVVCAFLCLLPLVLATDVSIVDSKDWTDVYSVSLYTALTTGERTDYVTSESLLAASKTFTFDTPLHIFESSNSPYIPSIGSQLQSAGYTIAQSNKSSDFNLDLDIRSGSYILLSDSNFRTSIAAAAYAANKRAWVLFVNPDNVNQVVARVTGAKSVLAIGQFPRVVRTAITPYVTETINNDDPYKDTQDLAKKFGLTDTVALADGVNLESEFFLTKNPVILSGFNRILDDTYNFLVANNIKNVVIVGNQLTVVGEQIRTRSQKSISVFIKFAQSDTKNVGNIFALTFFPLPQQTIGLNITKATYDPAKKQIVAYFENIGNSGVYALTTITLRQNGNEIGTVSVPNATYIAAGETLPVFFDHEIPAQNLGAPISGEFYTSYGILPTELDSFLTLENKFGPPFSIPITIESLTVDDAVLNLQDAAYYPSLNRIGITVFDNSTKPIYYTVKVNGLIVQGLKQDFAKSDQVGAQKARTTYIPVSLDSVDVDENVVFPLTITYGTAQDQEFKTITATPPFRTQSSGFLMYGIIAAVIIIIIIIVIFVMRRRKGPSAPVHHAAHPTMQHHQHYHVPPPR